MADSLDSRHGTSDEFIDPYCDPCYDDEGLNVRVRGFCKDCVQFLCSDCHRVHRNIQSCRNHDVVQGEDMPKSQADKPPRFEYCDIHPKLLKYVFCCEHKILLCAICSTSDHKGCSIRTVEDACGNVDVTETGALYGKIKTLQENLKSALPSINKDIDKIKGQQKTMLRDAQIIYDQTIARLNKLYDDIKKEIQTSCQAQLDRLSHQHKQFSDIITKLDSPLARLEELQAVPVDTKVFLRLQEIVSLAKKLTAGLQESHNQYQSTSLSFIRSQTCQDFLSSSFTFGTIQSSVSKYDAEIVIPEIQFPVSPLKLVAARPKTGQTPGPQNTGGLGTKPRFPKPTQHLSNLKATKQGTYNMKLKDDAMNCWITGMAITKDRQLLLADANNHKIKMFSHDMKFLFSVTLPHQPRDIAVISDREAAVTTNKSLVILDISGSQLSIKTTSKLSYDVHGISRYNDKLVVTSPGSNTPSVKLIDQTGRVYWSVSSDQQGQQLFGRPSYVSSPGDGRSSTVIVTDERNNTLTLLNGDTGEVITRRQLKERKEPRGVTTDTAGNIYVCNRWTYEVAVLSGDLLSEEKILLSWQDSLSDRPQAIVYDDEAHQLIISNFWPHTSVTSYFWPNKLVSDDQVDVFLLS